MQLIDETFVCLKTNDYSSFDKRRLKRWSALAVPSNVHDIEARAPEPPSAEAAQVAAPSVPAIVVGDKEVGAEEVSTPQDASKDETAPTKDASQMA